MLSQREDLSWLGLGRGRGGVPGWKLFGNLDLGVAKIWVEIFSLVFNTV